MCKFFQKQEIYLQNGNKNLEIRSFMKIGTKSTQNFETTRPFRNYTTSHSTARHLVIQMLPTRKTSNFELAIAPKNWRNLMNLACKRIKSKISKVQALSENLLNLIQSPAIKYPRNQNFSALWSQISSIHDSAILPGFLSKCPPTLNYPGLTTPRWHGILSERQGWGTGKPGMT